MEVTFRRNHVEARSIGEKSYQTAERLWTEITRLCNEHACYRVLGIAESNRNEFDKLKNLEIILVNRGFRGKVFADVEEARAGLLKD